MVYTRDDFHSRVGNVDKKRSKLLRRGHTARVGKNGIIIAKPKARRLSFPLKGTILMVLCFLSFKALLLSVNGPDTYSDRLAILQNGTAVEAMGAKLLAIDPATQFIADHVGPLLR